MAEEPVMLASSDQAEVRVITVVRDDEPAAGGEVARKWNDMGFRYPSAGENHDRSPAIRDERGKPTAEGAAPCAADVTQQRSVEVGQAVANAAAARDNCYGV